MTRERYLYPDVDAIRVYLATRKAHPPATTPIHIRDQAQAAAAEAEAFAHWIASRHQDAIEEMVTISAAARNPARRWLLRRLLEVPMGLARGDLQGCPHVEGPAPAPALATAWSRQVVCLERECLDRYAQAMSASPGDESCDRCGSSGALTHAMGRLGGILLVAALCGDCYRQVAQD